MRSQEQENAKYWEKENISVSYDICKSFLLTLSCITDRIPNTKNFLLPPPHKKKKKKTHVIISWTRVSREHIEVEVYIIQVKMQTPRNLYTLNQCGINIVKLH